MSRRTSIVKALAAKLNELIDGVSPYNTNLYGNAYPYLKFWDEVSNFPSIYMSPGAEYREYHPAAFKWGYLSISLKVYTKGDDAPDQLELLLEDIERVIDNNREILYDVDNNYTTTEILIQSITTDEGLLAPYGVGEVNIQVRYAIM